MTRPSTSVQVPHGAVPQHALPPPPPDDSLELHEARRLRTKRVMAGFILALMTTEVVAYAGALARRHPWFGGRNPSVDRAICVPAHPVRR
ncbi:MAG: hypothetical protein AB2A00_30575 [Myxococcota bacterium]